MPPKKNSDTLAWEARMRDEAKAFAESGAAAAWLWSAPGRCVSWNKRTYQMIFLRMKISSREIEIHQKNGGIVATRGHRKPDGSNMTERREKNIYN